MPLPKIMTPTNHKPLRRSFCCATALALLALCPGCGGGGEASFDDFEVLDLREQLVEVPLGKFVVPVPVPTENMAGRVSPANRLQIKFTLHGLVKPDAEKEITRLVERRAGQVRDGVIRVCRNSSIDDLLDPQMMTLKSRILDATQPLLDDVTLRRVLITNIMTEPL